MFIRYLTFIIFYCSFQAYGQADSARYLVDSAVNNRFDQQISRIHQLTAERQADSLKRITLELQIARLSNADNMKKAALLKEVHQLKAQDSLHLAKQRQQVDSLRHILKGYAVMFNNDTLFTIYARQGSFTAKERAQAVEVRLAALSKDYSFSPDSVKSEQTELSTDLLYRNRLLTSISAQDALWANSSPRKMARQYRQAIIRSVTRFQHDHSWQVWVREGLEALLLLVGLILFIYGLNRLFRWLLVKIGAKPGRLNKGIYIRNYELVNSAQQIRLIGYALTLLKWALALLLISLSLPVLFGIFPETKAVSITLLGYILNPLQRVGLAVWHYIPNLITIIVLLFIFRYVLRFFNYIRAEIARERLVIPGFYPDWATPTYQILRVLILLFMLIVIYPYLPGSDSPIFKGVSVFAGVLFTFGSAGALGNLVAGLVLTYMRAFKVGDRVKIGEVTGDVVEKTLLVTRLRTIQNEVVSIPNSTVMGNHTLNYSSEAAGKGLILNTTVTIGYDTPWRQVHELLISAALATPMIEPEPMPYVLQISLDDYYVSYRLNAFTREPNRQARIYSALHANIQDKFNEAGVEIMSPHYKALRDGNAMAVPPAYLPKDYQAPSYSVKQTESANSNQN